MTAPLTVHLNGQLHTGNCSPGTSLLSWLRQVGCASVHRVCESGDCGACTVWLDGAPIHSCLYPALRAQDHAVTTIEGLAQNGQLTPMQQAFLEHQGFQCGFCTPGMILSAEKLSFASEEELRLALRGSLCRCTGYQAIVESIVAGKQAVAGGQSASGSGDPVTAQVGQSVPKQDGPDIVTGKPVYTSDYAPSGLLHLKVLRSPHPHARIREIHTEQAAALPGVHAVLTYKDVDRRAYSTAGHSEPVPDPLDHYILDRKVRFIGDRVAAVVAESVAIAERACQLIEVE
ncbi:carbon monoxide dehydrogenase, partial [Leptolyngbya sp. FACHB-36]|uniref:2Fe-2S iron-sulfur cluster-binding protein n=1 Tax=Leptolyngbya sp. FACHB-36 TaxID=2692808 RepID=UPI0018F03536